MHLGGKGQCESKVSCSRTLQIVPNLPHSNLDCLIQRERTNHAATMRAPVGDSGGKLVASFELAGSLLSLWNSLHLTLNSN